MSKLFSAMGVVVSDGPIAIPPLGFIKIFARSNNTLWVKYSDGTEELLSVN